MWLLLIPLLGGLWWLLKNRPGSAIGAAADAGAVPIAPVAPAQSVTLDEGEHQNIKLYEERLVAEKTRQKTGDVAINKRVETEQAQISVPIEKERVVIERTAPTGADTSVAPDTADFRSGEVIRMSVYSETPDIHKEAFVREEVNVRKEVEQTTVEAQEQLEKS